VDSVADKKTQRARFRQIRDDFVRDLNGNDQFLSFSHIPSPLNTHLQAGVTLAGYVAKGSEADPSRLLVQAHKQGCQIALPHVTSKSAPMRFLRWSPGEPLIEGAFGLMQPDANAEVVQPDVLLVPLVAFDDQLMRLGQGAGHYDHALSLLENSFAVGIGWSIQHTAVLPHDPWDIPLDAMLTEKSWITL
jgi:5-formyltetrahydrofolate cyclo-ligase